MTKHKFTLELSIEGKTREEAEKDYLILVDTIYKALAMIKDKKKGL